MKWEYPGLALKAGLMAATFNVTNESELNAAIQAIDVSGAERRKTPTTSPTSPPTSISPQTSWRIFIQGDRSITFAPPAGRTSTIVEAIAD